MRIYISCWRYGLQFDVQYARRFDSKGNYSFKGHLWNWDYRRPWRLTKGD